MNIQFNLLPAVKLEYAKTQRNKRLTILIAGGVTAASLMIVISLFLVIQVFQKNYSKNLSAQIKDETKKLQEVKDINKILTVQNQLASLDKLHAQKPAIERLLPYVQQVTPKNVIVQTMSTDLQTSTIIISGTAPSITDVNKFVDTLKFTDFSIALGQDGTKKGCLKEQSYDDDKKVQVCQSFSSVVTGSLTSGTGQLPYSVTFKFDPLLFDGASNIKLVIPANKVTTRSEIEKPSLFQGQGGNQ